MTIIKVRLDEGYIWVPNGTTVEVWEKDLERTAHIQIEHLKPNQDLLVLEDGQHRVWEMQTHEG